MLMMGEDSFCVCEREKGRRQGALKLSKDTDSVRKREKT